MVRSVKPFCYLVQAASEFKPAYLGLASPQADLCMLTFKSHRAGAIHAPGSSWNQGRNLLLEQARRQGDYLYYIFLDDDISFEQGSFQSFEQFLLDVRPAIGTPRQWDYNQRCEQLQWPHHSVYAFDACFNAFHRDVIEDGLLLPYTEQYDDESWWYSQVMTFHLANLLYGGRILQDNGTHIKNGTNDGSGTRYPHANQFWKVEQYLADQVLAPGLDLSWLRRHPQASRSAGVHPSGAMPASHRVSPAAMTRLFRADWLSLRR